MQVMYAAPDIYSIYQMMERDHIIMSFKGHITKELMSSVYQIMESRLDAINEDPKKKKKVYNILVETLQNIYHHMDELQHAENPDINQSKDAMFMIVRGEDGIYKIHTGNYVLSNKYEQLQSRIDQINAMTTEELRAHYVDTLNTTNISEKGGAGLGIIDIARKSGNKLGYSFNPVSEKFVFFSLVVSIG